MSGYVTFVMGGREHAGRLVEVREVVRAVGVEPLAGARAPVTGLLTLRGTPVPVVDLRAAADPGDTGDVLVLTADSDGILGLAVDKVTAVIGPDDLVPMGAGEPSPSGLPAYVLEVRRDAKGRPVFVVALRALAGLVPA
ncbi:MAG: purine-binding chemotaxis protein CheW [Actinomycetota bacterium]|jgi:chemotaxis signal transduction protein|nr:purine-binding chemotaxis protein CheW [Actinomycetota bacterium]MDQ1643024.1 purine-binding chemotaxis protein CheW [Actinomycetota bacterium]